MKECFMIIANPGVNCFHEINISWHTGVHFKNSKIIYTEINDTSWKNANVINGTYTYCDVFDNVFSISSDRTDIYEKSIFLHYHVSLTNLKPNTKYMFKVGEKLFSEVHYFKTANYKYSFAWVSDFHAYTPIDSRISSAFTATEKMIQKTGDVDFILCGGDAIAWGGSYSFWLDMYERDLVKNYMWVNILGNHDHMSRDNLKNTADYFKEVNFFPQNGYSNQKGICYYFTYGNTLYIVLNNEVMTFKQDCPEVQEAKEWVEEILKNNTQKQIIICEHYDWFQGITGSSRAFGYLRWKDLFDKYNVNLAIGNNNHIYVRTHQIKIDKKDINGTMYIQSPSSDNERGQNIVPLKYNEDIIAARFSEGSKTIGILRVDIDEDSITIKLFDRYVNLIDYATINTKSKTD